ncbi:TPA: hypothetical protein ACH3X1_004935 [Trebouxia sp. C0004]
MSSAGLWLRFEEPQLAASRSGPVRSTGGSGASQVMLHRGAPSGLMTPDHKTRTVTLIVRGGCELKEAAKASSFSEAGYKRGRDQAIFRGKASSQGLNPKMTLVAQRKVRKVTGLLLLREDNAAIGYS